MVNSFQATRRVEFADTDMAGIAHFSSFFRYMEETEHAFLRSLGLSVVFRAADEQYSWPRVAAACDYVRPAKFEDVLDVELRVARLGTSSVGYRFLFSLDGQRIAEGTMTAVCCRIEHGRPPKSAPLLPAFLDQVQVHPETND
ncbi:MAG: acyl-CoA thioesterase [Planctomycetales bacterium]